MKSNFEKANEEYLNDYSDRKKNEEMLQVNENNVYKDNLLNKESHNDYYDGFKWWLVFGLLNITFGNIVLCNEFINDIKLVLILILINTVLMLFVLKLNKYAFLIATILSLNPIIWIINGIYLKNRWNHPKVN